ncbi:hypothetical protein VTJ49DRAFT_7221 [Mycothermus thermophilus]|uniref:Metallothionein n=1 Tax=Humicola insolens TaxID=85995 RepID=A0ABR3VPN2_HUMIN
MCGFSEKTVVEDKAVLTAVDDSTPNTITKGSWKDESPSTATPSLSRCTKASIGWDGAFFCECPFCVCGEAVMYPGEVCFTCLKTHS